MLTPEGNKGRQELTSQRSVTPVTRKDFLETAGVGIAIGTLFLSLIGTLRSAVPIVLPDPSRQFKVGKATDYAPGGVKTFAEENVIVFCDEEGLFAISAICTHLGCVVSRGADGFHCPCHGSKYDSLGKVLRGPAPKSLAWFQITRLADGQLSVDKAKEVAPGTKFNINDQEVMG